jgi:hypothetical protein
MFSAKLQQFVIDIREFLFYFIKATDRSEAYIL